MVEFRGITKWFGRVLALDDVSGTVERGRCTAIVGPNGSGKTTLVKIILGLVKPTAGEVRINGVPVDNHYRYRREIGYMPQIARYPENVRVREILDLIRKVRSGMQERIDDELIQELRLEPELNKRAGTLSGGTRQKLSAVIAFMFRPELLIFDEPTAGLDPVSSTLLKARIRRQKEEGRTIILTSHIMSEVEALADNVIFLMHGRIRWTGHLHDILSETGASALESAIAHLMEGTR